MTDRNFTVRTLGEIAIRCIDKDQMVAFYRDIIGLKLLNGADDRITFFDLGPGFGGHTTVLALFPHEAGPGEDGNGPMPAAGVGSSLHHIALSLAFGEQDAVMAWYEKNGLDFQVQYFDWVGWRGVFTRDPDGNTVELVARDPAWTGPA